MKYIICSRIYVEDDEERKESIVGIKKSANSPQPSSSASKRNKVRSKKSNPSKTSKLPLGGCLLRKKPRVPIRPTENNGLSQTEYTTSSLSSKSSQKQPEPKPEPEVPEPKIILTAEQSI